MMRRALYSLRGIALCAALGAALLCGCKSTGVYANVGDVSAPVEISDSSDTINVRALFSLTGAKVWSAKDSRVKIAYTNCYTNVYFGVIDRRGIQGFGVEVNPTVDEAEEEGAEKVDGTTETAGTDAALSTDNQNM